MGSHRHAPEREGQARVRVRGSADRHQTQGTFPLWNKEREFQSLVTRNAVSSHLPITSSSQLSCRKRSLSDPMQMSRRIVMRRAKAPQQGKTVGSQDSGHGAAGTPTEKPPTAWKDTTFQRTR